MATAQNFSSDTIASDRVEGTSVYGPDEEKIGSVRNLIIAKREGNVTDAVVSVGGFLGMGSELHSVPWNKLNYNTDLDGYLIDATKEQLIEAPTFSENAPDSVYDREYQDRVYSYYGVAPYWQ